MQPATECKADHAEGDSALCEKSVLPDSRTGLKHQTDTGLKCPAASQECLLAAVFIRRCGQSVAAAVGESRRFKKYLHRQFQSFSDCDPLTGILDCYS